MLYMHDVWANWFYYKESRDDIPYFHEWKRSDKISIVDQTPILLVDEALYNYLENTMDEIPEAILNRVENKSFIREDQSRKIRQYLFIVTDGKGILMIDTDGFRFPSYKSRIIPRQERLVLELVEGRSYDINPKDVDLGNYEYISDDIKTIGLTRREKELRKVLIEAINDVENRNNSLEMKYWSSSFQDNDGGWYGFKNKINKGWSSKHEEIALEMLKFNDDLRKLWKEIEDKFSKAK